jgi:hypothetical protein
MKPSLGHRRLHCLLAAFTMLAFECQHAFADTREVDGTEARSEERHDEKAQGDSKAVMTPRKGSVQECPGTVTKPGSDKLRLIFRRETLENIATAFNRCNVRPQIRVLGTSLQTRRYTLTVDADDPNSLLDYLAVDENVVIEIEDTQRFVVRLRSQKATAPKQSTAGQRNSMQSDLIK